MRITLVISSLERGGAERIICLLASAWAEQGKQVTLIPFDDREPPAYPIHRDVELQSLHVTNEAAGNPWRALYRNVWRIQLLRRLIRKSRPDIVISFLDFPNVITLLATRRLGVPVVVSERANPQYVEIKRIWKFLRRKLYPLAAALVCQTQAMVAQLQQEIKVAGYAIPNPVVLPMTSANGMPGGSKAPTVIAMGRLVPQKGFDLLLEAFAGIAARHPDWSLKVLGKGPLKQQLESQAKSLGLKDRVHFVGTASDPFSVLRAADLFVFSSRFEGFGNALAEAMACGLPVISYDCPAGPSEIVRHEVDGILVPREDVAGLAKAMDRLMSDPAERQRLGRRAPEVLSRFSLERILDMWEAVFRDVLCAKHGSRTFPRTDVPGATH
jgi:GalNAc-alpha-(1->4)-GalNAc-alpha-(1->3)-diNAcBac-PP-undecaprenol alpha-1,4-N-acetyl-D-galactosaminyltransferase